MQLSDGRDLGELGQNHFRSLCSENSLSAVAAAPDRHGWDFFVEFDHEIDPSIPLDRQGELLKVLVQVKATETATSSVPATLSALKRLVDTNLPAFIAHMEYTKGRHSPSRVRILHIGRMEIEKILHRVRKAESKGRTDINKIKMHLPLADAHNIDVEGDHLKQCIQAAANRNLVPYAEWKSKTRNSCGYDGKSITISFDFGDGIGGKEIVSLMLGETPFLPINGAIIKKSRFGISLENDTDHIGSAQLRIDVTPRDRGSITVINPKNKHRTSMEVDVFVPNFPGIKDDEKRIRLSNNFIDLNISLGTEICNLSFNIDPDMRLTIERLSEALAFGAALNEIGAHLEFKIGASKAAVLTNFEGLPTTNFYWKAMHEFTEFLCLALFKHRRGSRVEVTLNEVSEAFESNREMFLVRTQPEVEFEFQLDDHSTEHLPSVACLYAPNYIEFKQMAFFSILKIPLTVSFPDSSTLRFKGDTPSVVEDGVNECELFNAEMLNSRVEKIRIDRKGHHEMIVTTTIGTNRKN